MKKKTQSKNKFNKLILFGLTALVLPITVFYINKNLHNLPKFAKTPDAGVLDVSSNPRVEFISHKWGDVVKGKIKVVTTASDSDGISSHRIFVDNTGYPIREVSNCPGSPVCSVDIDIEKFPLKDDGKLKQFVFVIEAYDRYGNLGRKYIEVTAERSQDTTYPTGSYIQIYATAKSNIPNTYAQLRIFLNKTYTNQIVRLENKEPIIIRFDKKFKKGDLVTLGFDNDTSYNGRYTANRDIYIQKVVIDDMVVFSDKPNDADKVMMEKFNVMYDRADRENGGVYPGVQDGWGGLYWGFWDYRGIYTPVNVMNWNGGFNIFIK